MTLARIARRLAAWTAWAALVALPGLALAHAPAGEWKRVDPSGPVLGADGRWHEASCSGFPGTDPSFSFWTRRGKSRNLVVYFEGGGACWDNLSCSFPIAEGLPPQLPQFYVPAIDPRTDPGALDGLFKQDPANPVRDWDMVYIPYCTGDIHIGSADRSYANVGNPLLPVPQFEIRHRGFDNFMVVLDWIRKNVRAPKNVLVTGASAGGYGASAHLPWVARTFPRAHMFALADASQGVTTPAFDAGNPGRQSWNPQLAPWAFGPDPAAVPSPELLATAARALPRAKVAQFTTPLDGVQVQFYAVMKQYYGPGGSCPNPAVDWNNQMLQTLQTYNAELGNFRHYVAAGDYHTLLRSPLFYSETSAGPAFSDWLGGMLRNRGGTHFKGGQWKSVACPDCLTPLPCQ